MTQLAGVRLGPYEILEPLGAGGMGEVYRALDPRLEREVAVKVLRSEVASDPDRLRRFEREAKTVAALNHPHILTVHDVGTHEGTPYVVTELLEGETLREVMKRRTPTREQVLTFAVQIARGLAAAHDREVVHRDIKPENLFLTTDGRIKILDFGLAKLAVHEADFRSAGTLGASEEHSTSPGVILGTVAYMSPEQAQAHPLDPRSDIFSFGVVLYEMLAGRHPFLRETAPATLNAIVNESPPALATLDRGIPPPLGRLVGRCLEKLREDRFRGAHDLALALEAVLQAPSGALSLQEVAERGPYPGLSSFTEKDAPHFFGREGEVTALWEKLRSRHLLAVIGPSGAGKTSFVHAGVLPSRPGGWAAIVCTPGRHPFRRLGQALGPALAGDSEALSRLAGFEELETALDLLTRWRRGQDEALVVVDQFEELFTQAPDDVQARFAELIGRLTREADVHVLLSLRDDFLMRCHAHAPLARVFSELTPLDTLTREGLRRAIEEPAKTEGYAFEDDALVEEMLDAVEGARGALPLLAFAVSRLWEKRDREAKRLTRRGYEEIGGVAGALAQHAEQTLERVGNAREGMVREIFRNLVTSQGTRASSDREELLSVFPERDAAEEVLDELVDARLLTSYEVHEPAPSSRGPSLAPTTHRIEIVHESLLKAWPRLVWWQAQDEEGAHLRDQLKQAAHLWEERERSPDLLWSGAAYREFEVWRDRYPGQLTAVEEDFTQAMVERSRRRRRLRQGVTAGVLAVALAVAAGTGVLWQRAERARDHARLEALRAEASKLLALAQARLADDPTEALAYAIASLELADTGEARRFAVRALTEAPPAREVATDCDGCNQLAFSPDGARFASAGFDTDVRVWTEDGRGPIRLPGHPTTAPHIVMWASSGLLVTGLAPLTADSRWVRLWTFPGGQRVRTIDLGRKTWWQVNGDRLLGETVDSEPDEHPIFLLRSWKLPDGEAETLGRMVVPPGSTMSVFEPGGRAWLYVRGREVYRRTLPVTGDPTPQLLCRDEADALLDSTPHPSRPDWFFTTGAGKGDIRIWSTTESRPRMVRRIPRPETASEGSVVKAEPSGQWLVEPPEVARPAVRLWGTTSLPGARPLVLRRSGSWNTPGGAFHPSGRWYVAATHAMSHLTFWPLHEAHPEVIDGYRGMFRPVTFTADGRWLATSWPGEGDLGRIRLWPLPGTGPSDIQDLNLPEAYRSLSAFFLTPDPKGRFLVGVTGSIGQYLVPLDGSPVRKLEHPSPEREFWSAAVSPSGRWVATAPHGGSGEPLLIAWNVETGERRLFELPEAPSTPVPMKAAVISVHFVDETTLYTGGVAGLLRWNLETGTHETVLAAPPGQEVKVALSADGRTALARWHRTGGVLQQACEGFEVVHPMEGTRAPVTTLGDCPIAFALDPSGDVAVTGDFDGVVRVGRVSGGEPHLLFGHEGAVDSVAISPDLRWVASSGDDNTLRLWPMPDFDRPPLHTLPHDELVAKLESLTNLRAVRSFESATEWTIELDTFPGWKEVPSW